MTQSALRAASLKPAMAQMLDHSVRFVARGIFILKRWFYKGGEPRPRCVCTSAAQAKKKICLQAVLHSGVWFIVVFLLCQTVIMSEKYFSIQIRNIYDISNSAK